MDYRDKLVLAPMVRVGTLPFRLLALEYGADIVYSEELIDKKLVECERIENNTLKTIDYVEKNETNNNNNKNRANRIVYQRQQDLEKGKSVLQMGTADAVTALKAANVVIGDIDALDINMGCPVSFSTLGGMGSKLLSKPETVHDILTTLVRNFTKPITCKIRLLDDVQKTIDFVRMVESTGVKAIGIHCRQILDRPRFPAKWDWLRPIVEATSLPVIGNGDIYSLSDAEKFKEYTHCSSVMFARGAIYNCAVFDKNDKINNYFSNPHIDINLDSKKHSNFNHHSSGSSNNDQNNQNNQNKIQNTNHVTNPGIRISNEKQMEILTRYVTLATEYGNHCMNTKYVLLEMLNRKLASDIGQKIVKAKSSEDLIKIFNINTQKRKRNQLDDDDDDDNNNNNSANNQNNNVHSS